MKGLLYITVLHHLNKALYSMTTRVQLYVQHISHWSMCQKHYNHFGIQKPTYHRKLEMGWLIGLTNFDLRNFEMLATTVASMRLIFLEEKIFLCQKYWNEIISHTTLAEIVEKQLLEGHYYVLWFPSFILRGSKHANLGGRIQL